MRIRRVLAVAVMVVLLAGCARTRSGCVERSDGSWSYWSHTSGNIVTDWVNDLSEAGCREIQSDLAGGG